MAIYSCHASSPWLWLHFYSIRQYAFCGCLCSDLYQWHHLGTIWDFSFYSVRLPYGPCIVCARGRRIWVFISHAKSQGLVGGIPLPAAPSSQLLNGHFADDSFLTLIEDKTNIRNAMQCLDTFCLASGSSIQWRKTQCYRQSFLPALDWLSTFE